MALNNLLLIFAIGIASNIDNAGVGIAYGVRKVGIPLISNTIIALMGFVLALGGGLFGHLISHWLTPFTCQLISMLVLISLGIYVLAQQFFTKAPEAVYVFSQQHQTDQTIDQFSDNHLLRVLRNPEEADLDNSKSISLTESIILGIALSLNNLAGGFSAGITKLNILTMATVSGLFSFLCTGLCAMFGLKFASEKFGERATTISAILLILVGIHQIMN
ncbi:manganese efflux pump [Desulfosporosinus sp. FKA]|uniref:manganese efflux pump n=1 Tax=Desulfosporosinus sp. FKA TaxID=1969834 RepID=UPI000B4A3075|nr:manganese efflux pump [Desulfosporosinus sp. FKA]